MANLSRRTLLLGGAGILGTVTLLNKPHDQSGPRAPYFLSMQNALIEAGIATPTLVIDRKRLNHNIDTLVGHLPKGMGYRIVTKSLPSLDLIQHIRARSGSDRLMTFNQPMLSILSTAMPQASQLLGKPLPIAAVKNYFKILPTEFSGSADRVQWLIDTPRRLQQYTDLAKALGRTFAINLELDVGLHRGGFEPGAELNSVLNAINSSSALRFAGYMGYEPHLPVLPSVLGWRDRAKADAWRRYRDALDQAALVFDAKAMAGITRNAAGSPTYRYYKDTSLANEVSAGSCLVKPTHFDTDLLEPHEPASFIATPVIKSLATTHIPGLEFADGVKRIWNSNSSKTVFIYGGHWLADPVDPPGLSYNATFGRSSNQEMLNGGPELEVAVDDFVFFRPQQSEAVFLQFGDIAIYDDGKITDYWPVFPASA